LSYRGIPTNQVNPKTLMFQKAFSAGLFRALSKFQKFCQAPFFSLEKRKKLLQYRTKSRLYYQTLDSQGSN